MKKSTFLSLIALIVALAGVMIAVAAYLKHRSCVLCDDYEEDILDDDMDLDAYLADDGTEDIALSEEDSDALLQDE